MTFSISSVLTASLQNVQISFSAPSRIHAGRDLVLDCRPNLRNANNFGLIHGYMFLFQRENEDIMPLAGVTFNNKGEEVVTWGNDLLESRSTIKHQLGLANVSFARVFISEVDCADTAEYTCVMESHRASRNVEVIRKYTPCLIYYTIVLTKYLNYTDSRLLITCTFIQEKNELIFRITSKQWLS